MCGKAHLSGYADIDRSYRFVFGSAQGSGDTGGGYADIRLGEQPDAARHLHGGFFTDRAVGREGLLLDGEQIVLDNVGIGADAAVKGARRAADRGDPCADHPAGTAFRCRDLLLLSEQLVYQQPGEILLTDVFLFKQL